jgi:hypothetical protein
MLSETARATPARPIEAYCRGGMLALFVRLAQVERVESKMSIHVVGASR